MMSESLETIYVARVAARALKDGAEQQPACRSLLETLFDYQDALGLELPEEVERAFGGPQRTRWLIRLAVARHLAGIVAALEEIGSGKAGPETDELGRNLGWLAADLGLDRRDREILELALRYTESGIVESMVDDLSGALKSLPRALAVLLAMPRRELQARLAADGALAESGLVTVNPAAKYLASSDGDEWDFIQVPGIVRRCLRQRFAGPAALRGAIFGGALEGSLSWQDFAHLGAERDLAARVLGGAIDRRARGINVLLYGPPGSGKTEFCKTLARHLACALYPVGEAGPGGVELRRDGRLGALRLIQRLATRCRHTLLLFDEMEDLQPGYHGPYGGQWTRSKVFFNRLLEDNPVPVLWTANDIGRFDPAILRRMTLVLEVKTPGPRERARLWRRMAADSGLDYPAAELGRLGDELEVAPAIAASALRAAELAAGGLDDVQRAARALAKAVQGGRSLPPARGREAPFDLGLTNADLDLARLAERVTRPGAARDFSLCLYGPSGTGKSAYARHLALAMDLQPLKKGVSDLFSKWIGETEERIAQAFGQAIEEQAFLIFDEADALLGDRAGAQRSWEITQVAEMLTWMEVHPLPFCCTTNLMERLDRASLRRFTFKVKFDSLTRDQLARAFEVFFGLQAPAGVLALANLTPGDFATVGRKARILDCARDPGALAAMLVEESRAKPDHAGPIGFLR